MREIARRLKVDRNTVRKWARKEEGDVEDKQRCGRPSKVTPNTKRRIRGLCKDRVTGIRSVVKKLNFSTEFQNRGKKIGVTTVRRYVRSTDWGKNAYKEPVKPLLSEKNINDRMKFCERLIREGFVDNTPEGRVKRAHILFTDESPIELNPKPNRQNRRIRTNDPASISPVLVPKFSLKIMVAGGISRYGKTDLHIVPQNQTVNGEYYRQSILPIFKKAMDASSQFPKRNMGILMQDGATAHTAKATMKVIKEGFNSVWTDWPGNSPDFNVIEHLWAKLQDSVFRQPRPRNRDQLIARVQEEWESIDQNTTTNLVESFSRRIIACHGNNGGHTKY